MLAVLRPRTIHEARGQLDQLLAAGLEHVEIAVQVSEAWVVMVRELRAAFPALRLGAASVCDGSGLQAALAAGLRYAVSPILDPALQHTAQAAAITLVPGVFSPTEIALAQRCGAPAVKLFPAAALGPAYWRSLAGPLGRLPFCIAAGGLAPGDVLPWLTAGVDAVALGNSLFDDAPASGVNPAAIARLKPDLAALLTRLAQADNR